MWAKCFKNSCKRVRFHLLTLTLRSISFTVSIKPFNVRQKGAKMKTFVTFFVLSGRFKDGWIQFSACKFIKNWIFFENLFDVFCLLSRNTYFDEQLVSRCSCLYLTRPPSIVHKQRHFYLMLKKTPITLPSSQLIEKKTPVMFIFTFTEAATRSCSLNKSVHHLWSGLKRLFLSSNFLLNTDFWRTTLDGCF